MVLEVKPEFQKGMDALDDIYVASSNIGTSNAASSNGAASNGATSNAASSSGGQVRLSTIARVSEKTAPLLINHLGQFPSATISFNIAPGYSLGHAVDAIRAAQQEIGLPASVQTRFQGAALAFQASLDNTLLLILAAIVTMYIVLGVLYESYIHPVTIPDAASAGGLAPLALMISATT